MIGEDKNEVIFRFQRLSFAASVVGMFWVLRFFVVRLIVTVFDTVSVGGPMLSMAQILVAILVSGEFLLLFSILLYLYQEAASLIDYGSMEGLRLERQKAANQAYRRLFAVSRTVGYSAVGSTYLWMVWNEWYMLKSHIQFWFLLSILLFVPIALICALVRVIKSSCGDTGQQRSGRESHQRCREQFSRMWVKRADHFRLKWAAALVVLTVLVMTFGMEKNLESQIKFTAQFTTRMPIAVRIAVLNTYQELVSFRIVIENGKVVHRITLAARQFLDYGSGPSSTMVSPQFRGVGGPMLEVSGGTLHNYVKTVDLKEYLLPGMNKVYIQYALQSIAGSAWHSVFDEVFLTKRGAAFAAQSLAVTS